MPQRRTVKDIKRFGDDMETKIAPTEEHRLMYLGLMTLARKQYLDLENVRKTTATLLRDDFIAQLSDPSGFEATMRDHLSDIIYGEEPDMSVQDRFDLLMKKIELTLPRYSREVANHPHKG